MHEQLRSELLKMQADDLTTRQELIDAGELYGPHLPKDWYHPRMAAVHRRNNARMAEIMAEHGWPGRSLVGGDGAEAAWLVVQHAVLSPDLQQQALILLKAAVQAGEAPGWQWAMLTDRVLMLAGQLQLYGSQFVDDGAGGIAPWPIADPERVDERRQAIGMSPLAEHQRKLQQRTNLEQQVQQSAEAGPPDKSEP